MPTPKNSLHRPTIAFLTTIGMLVVLVYLLRFFSGSTADYGGKPIIVSCAAGIKPPVLELARDFEDRFSTRIELRYGGSGTLLGGLLARPIGDLYLAADDSFINKAREAGIVGESLSLARLTPVIAVKKGNPLGILSLEDLARDDVSVAVGSPEACAIGEITRTILEENNLWDKVRKRARTLKPTVNGLANDLALGAIDATVVWDATVAQYDDLEAIPDTRLQAHPRTVEIGVLSSSVNPAAALRFARFLASEDRGAPVFERYGYEPTAGDPFSSSPELTLMAGAMLSQATSRIISEFEKREGVTINRIFNGCGILVAQMRAGARPDAYFACDGTFLDPVSDLFLEGTVISANEMVILVQPKNPKGITGVKDLLDPQLRVGLAHPEKSALGELTRDLFRARGLADPFDPPGRLEVESATGDFLVNQIRTGSLDAVIVYRSNAALATEEVDVIGLEHPAAMAHQPFAISRETPHKELLSRLLQRLRGQDSREHFESLGFLWMEPSDR